MGSKIRLSKNIDRALEEITSYLNSLRDEIREIKGSARKEGKEKIRIVEDNGSYKVQFKTEKGWIESDTSVSTGFKFKED